MNHQTCNETKRQCEICSQWYCPECYGRVCDTCHERRCNNCSAVEGNTVVCKRCSALECCVCGDVQFTPESEFAVTDGYGIWPCQAQACGVPVCNECKFRDPEGLWLCRVCYRARGNSLADIMKREWVEFHHDSDEEEEEESEEEEDCHVCDRLPRLESQQDDADMADVDADASDADGDADTGIDIDFGGSDTGWDMDIDYGDWGDWGDWGDFQ